MTESLIAELGRSPDADLRRVGQALALLSPSSGSGIPRASEALAEFLAVPQARSVRPGIAAPAPAPDLVIELGSPAGANRRRVRRPGLPGLLGGGLFVKAVLGAAAVLAAGAGLAAVAGPLGHDTVVVTPSSPTATSASTAPSSAVTDDGHEGRAHVGDADDGRHQRNHRVPGTAKTAAPAQPDADRPWPGQATDSDGAGSGSDADEGPTTDEPGDDDSDDGSEDRSDDGSDDGAEFDSDERDVDPTSADADSGDGSRSGPSAGTEEGSSGAADG